uniref:citrate synthase (unknown stereospecificity) n=1 Tax=Candidatus Kentrum sp. FW TaxID=2126338 RepID=A0A450TST9_9GAMM|nr:MAG: Citrate synthase [Candidatus Kentron sp. FW]
MILAKTLSKEVLEEYGEQLYKTSEAATDFFEQKYQKYANPELYVAVLLGTLGFQPKEVSSIIFMGRLAGVCAHIIEENSPMRLLFRGNSLYTSPATHPVVPLEERELQSPE